MKQYNTQTEKCNVELTGAELSSILGKALGISIPLDSVVFGDYPPSYTEVYQSMKVQLYFQQTIDLKG